MTLCLNLTTSAQTLSPVVNYLALAYSKVQSQHANWIDKQKQVKAMLKRPFNVWRSLYIPWIAKLGSKMLCTAHFEPVDVLICSCTFYKRAFISDSFVSMNLLISLFIFVLLLVNISMTKVKGSSIISDLSDTILDKRLCCLNITKSGNDEYHTTSNMHHWG